MGFDEKFKRVLDNFAKEMYGERYNRLAQYERGMVRERAYNAGYRPELKAAGMCK